MCWLVVETDFRQSGPVGCSPAGTNEEVRLKHAAKLATLRANELRKNERSLLIRLFNPFDPI